MIPVPRSFNQILADLLDSFLSRTGLSKIRPGSPLLSIMMAAAQSDLRSSKDTFDLLNSNSLDRATGLALDRLGADENCPRLSESPSSGSVTVGDSSITRVATTVYQGRPAPIVGASVVYVADASAFDTSGSIYVGRGTLNVEGPLAYTSITPTPPTPGTYYAINLTTPTLKYHNLGESVVMAQGGNRVISPGTVAQTSQGSTSSSVQFTTSFSTTLPDGEVSLSNVQVIASKAGVSGNIPAGAINSFSSSGPFTGATVTNPLPFTNGQATEADDAYRERIKQAKQSRSRGTALAIQSSVIGVIATDENKKIISSSLVANQGAQSLLVIDDGTGYEEVSTGVAIETLVDSAVGGEQYSQIAAPRPVTKAFVASTATAPFAMVSGSILAVKVGGLVYEHTFAVTDFRAPSNATAYEIVASINGNSTIGFNARTASSGTKVVIFAKLDVNEDIQVVAPALGVDANDILLFSTARVDTMKLYRSDRLLYKDGLIATLQSNAFGTWDTITSSKTLVIDVDGTGLASYTFDDAAFVDAATGYTTVGNNSVDAWVKVLNYKVPGITAVESSGLIVLTSNVGASDRALLTIDDSSDLVAFKMFDADTSVGQGVDYTLGRNTGQIRLETPLVAGERLSIGSVNTRGFVESALVAPVVLSADAKLWFTFDSAAEIINTGLTLSTGLAITKTAFNWPTVTRDRVKWTCGTAVFTNVQAGDWLIVWDSAVLSANNKGLFRVCAVDTAFKWFEVDSDSGTTQTMLFYLAEAGMVFVRATGALQAVTIASGATTHTASSFATALNSALFGGRASVSRTNYLRVTTDSFGSNGDVALVAQNTEALKLKMVPDDKISNNGSQLAFVESAASGTPCFEINTISASGVGPQPTITRTTAVRAQDEFVHLTPYINKDSDCESTAWGHRQRGSANAYFRSFLELGVTGGSTKALTTRTLANREYIVGDWVYLASPYSMTPDDDLTIVVDQDIFSKRFAIPMARKLTPTTGTYGMTNTFVDFDNGGASLAAAFGTAYDFNDYAVFMYARAVSHSGTANKEILWRYYRVGLDGNSARVAYVYPNVPSSDLAVGVDIASSASVNVDVQLPSGAAKTGLTFRPTTRIGRWSHSLGYSQYICAYIFGYPVASATRVIRIEYSGATGGGVLFSGTITGSVHSYTATVVTDVRNVPLGTGVLTISSPTGQFEVGEGITDTVPNTATLTVGSYGYVTLTLTLPTNIMGVGAADVTRAGLITGNSIYLNGSGNFPSGPITLEAYTSNTVSYSDTSAVATTEASVGTVSYDVGNVDLVSASPAVVVGDIFSVSSTAGWGDTWEDQPIYIREFGDQYVAGYAYAPVTAHNPTPSWALLVDPDAAQFFSLTDNDVTTIANAVNALAVLPNSICPVTATVLGSSIPGTVTKSTFDELIVPTVASSVYYNLVDGLNFVRTTTYVAPNYQFLFKNTIDATLALGCDWISEEILLVPITCSNLVDWMNSFAISGLSSTCEIRASSQNRCVQIASLTPGTAGSVQVQGGTANSATASVTGTASSGGYPIVQVNSSSVDGFLSDSWVRINNSEMTPCLPFNATTVITGITVGGLFTASITKCVTTHITTSTDAIWKVEKQGSLVCYSITDREAAVSLASVVDGDWLVVQAGATSAVMSNANIGSFRILKHQDGTIVKAIWVENPNAIEEEAHCKVDVLSADSIMAGDIININTDMFGVDNMGTWTVTAAGVVGGLTDYQFQVSTTLKTPVVYGPGAVTALGTNWHLFQILDSTPVVTIKKLMGISPNQTDGTLADFKLNDSTMATRISTNYGSVITALDKLNFPIDLAIGVDGYAHSVGLIGEATRVIYGDPNNPSSYPGVVAVNSNVNVSGPMVKRVTCALSLRVRTGVSTSDIASRVQSAVAGVVNSAGVGESISISDIISAASKVNGVVAVAVVYPTYSSSDDQISCQPYEKLQVLNLETDVTVTFVGV